MRFKEQSKGVFLKLFGIAKQLKKPTQQIKDELREELYDD